MAATAVGWSVEAAAAFLIVGSLFQAAGVLVLWTAGPGARHHAMAALLLVNLVQPLGSAFGFPEASAWTRTVAALDAYSTPLIVMAIAHLLGRWARPLQIMAWASAIAMTLAHLVGIAAEVDVPLRALPYVASVVLLLVVSARGDDADHWMAAAFIPRAAYFGARSAITLMATPAPGAMGLIHQFALFSLLPASAIGALLLARRGGAWVGIGAATLGFGTLSAVAFWLARPVPFAAVQFLDGVTLYIARPLLLYVGFVRQDLSVMITRTISASVVALGCALGAEAATGRPGAALALGFGAGLIALAVAESLRPRLWSRPKVARTKAPPARPQWQLIILALRGSSVAGPRAGWTQQGLARELGIDVKRISAFPADMGARAEARLDQFLPGWRAAVVTTPLLIEVREGLVTGVKGPRVHYRLTLWGERLAEAVERQTVKTEARQVLTVPDSG